MKLYFEIAGWIGAFILVSAYFLSSFRDKKISTRQIAILNLIASLFLLINAIYFVSYPFIIVNSFWAIISIIKMIQSLKK